MNGAMRLHRPALIPLVALALSACVSQAPPVSPTATSSPPSPVPITVTPTLAASLPSPSIVKGPSGEVQALGIIRNQAPAGVTDIDLAVKFLSGHEGDILSETQVRPLLPYLPAGGSSPIVALFQGAGAPSTAQTEVLRYTEWRGETAEVAVSAARALPAAESRTRVVGYMQAPGRTAVQIDGLEVLALDDTGSPTTLAESVSAPMYLAPGAQVPFQALLLGRFPLSSARVYLAAAHTEPRPPSKLEVKFEPGWQVDPQGNLFLLGTLRNGTDTPQTGEILLAFRRGASLLGVVDLYTRIPLAPGELRPFAVSNPPLLAGTEPGDVQIEANPQPQLERESELTVVHLSVQVTAAETLGSRVFLRGLVVNDQANSVSEPTLFAALRATDGSLWSAAWQPLGGELHAGERHEFVLSLPLPEGAELPFGEFDLRALGLASE